MRAFRLRMKEAMMNSHISARTLAKRLGVSPSTVSRWASGASEIDMESRIRIARELGIPYDDEEQEEDTNRIHLTGADPGWVRITGEVVPPKAQGIFTNITPPPDPPSHTTLHKAEILRDICDEEVETFIRKNTDYGDSFANLRRALPEAVLVRIYDKWSRLATLMRPGATAQVNDESIEDTLADLANYANMELLERRLERKG